MYKDEMDLARDHANGKCDGYPGCDYCDEPSQEFILSSERLPEGPMHVEGRFSDDKETVRPFYFENGDFYSDESKCPPCWNVFEWRPIRK